MKQQIISEVVQQMLPHLDNAQMQQLQRCLKMHCLTVRLQCRQKKKDMDDNPKLMDAFVAAKRIEGCSEKTLKYYRTTIETMVASIDKGDPPHSDGGLAFLSDRLSEQEPSPAA